MIAPYAHDDTDNKGTAVNISSMDWRGAEPEPPDDPDARLATAAKMLAWQAGSIARAINEPTIETRRDLLERAQRLVDLAAERVNSTAQPPSVL